MSRRRPHLSVVRSEEPSAEEMQLHFLLQTGRSPSPVELEAFARWWVAVGWALPQGIRKSAARVITGI
jgi:hypothetical protein